MRPVPVSLFAGAVTFFCLLEVTVAAQNLADFSFNSVPLPSRRWVLVILADYPGQSVTGSDSQWRDLMFASPPGFSVANYEEENSNGRFTIQAASGLPLRVQMSAADTWASIQGANTNWSSSQVDAEALGRVVKKALDTSGFSFGVYDADRNGTVQSPSELSIVVVNPLSNNNSAGNRNITPQRDAANTLSVAGVVISCDHSVTFETICHEFGHSFGIFSYEMYTLRNGANAVNQGMSLMSTSPDGSQGAGLVDTPNWNPGRLHFDPWHKMRFGWSEPRVATLGDGGRFDLPVATAGDVNAPVLLYDPARGTHEFFVLEYRSSFQSAVNYDVNFGRDNPAVAEGLVIWQIQTRADLAPFQPPWLPPDPALYTQFTNGNSTTIGYSSSILCRCPPDLNPFVNAPWTSGQTTPYLRWFDGTATSTRVRVLPFARGTTSITVQVLAEYDTWVDFATSNFIHLGTFDLPYATLQQGVTAVSYGGNLRLKTGSATASPITINKAMTLTAYGGPVTIN